MKTAVLGAGAIGCLVAGYLKDKGEDISLVGHPDSVRAIKEKGLEISGARGNFKIDIEASEKLNHQPDLLILATKTQNINTALKNNLEFLKGVTILTTQNGVQADDLVAKYVTKENIISSIVMFGATYLEPGKVVHNFEGSWILGRMNRCQVSGVRCQEEKEQLEKISGVLGKIFPVTLRDEIRGMKYLKIFVNANNCIAAILGKSMQEAFSDLEISKISIAIWKEGLEVVNKAGIKLESLPDFPLERLTKLTLLPIMEAAKIFSGIMTNLSKEPLYGSILQSIKRGRTSEIDYLNGEFVALAKKNNLAAPLNKKLVEMVYQVEQTGRFCKKEDLIVQTKEFLTNLC